MRLKQARCPECAKRGRDNHEDNLIIYPDGHSHCYSCGYHTQAGAKKRMENSRKPASQLFAQLPEDFSFDIPEKALCWVQKYLTLIQIKQHNLGWSEEKQFLIFPYFDVNQELLAWQGRYFGENPKHPKWLSYGKIHEFLHILPEKALTSTNICLVEDILSAIKVSEVTDALPLFGSNIPNILLTRLYNLGYTKLIIWLDPDKRKETLKFNQTAKTFGFQTQVIFSDKDPKDYSLEQIKQKLG